MTTHAMIDLETLGTNYDATVLTIGGVKFNPLIELRVDFDPEMAASVNLIK